MKPRYKKHLLWGSFPCGQRADKRTGPNAANLTTDPDAVTCLVCRRWCVQHGKLPDTGTDARGGDA
jgi:hypothetical protein